MLTFKDYEDALTVQDACNLSGVVRSFSQVLSSIWDEARELNKGTDYVNTHPISVMYASKIASLSGCEAMENFSLAYDVCESKSKELEVKSRDS